MERAFYVAKIKDTYIIHQHFLIIKNEGIFEEHDKFLLMPL
jgi:hypothetical protein